MTSREKTLYHQIHPLKLITDWTTGLIALYFFWRHDLLAGLLIAFIPSVIVSLLLVRYVDLENLKRSRFGRYVRRYMTRTMESVRLAGYAVMAVGAWFHTIWLIPVGLVVLLFGWLRGVFYPGIYRDTSS